MRWLVALSLRNRIVVVALAALLVVAAVRTLRTTPLDVFPEFAPPLVEVQTEVPGLSTNDVEALVTVPLEAALNGVPGLDTIRSKSVLGLSSVVLVLDPSTDVMRSRQMVQERLSRAAATLPAVARPPVMLSPLSSLSRVMKIGLTSDDPLASGNDHAGQVDGSSAADGDSRGGQRRHLGPARSPASGAGRPDSPPGPRRSPWTTW